MITANILKFRTLYSIPFWPKNFDFIQLFLKILSGKANNVDPEQTESSGSALFVCAIFSEILVYKILGHLP